MPKPRSKIIAVRVPLDMHRLAKGKAGNDLTGYVRGLIAADLGIEPPEMPQGFAAISEKVARKIQKQGGKSRRKTAGETQS